MEVILLERIEKLGRIGDVVRVRPGYARNFLLPQNKAVRATVDNKTRFEAERAQLEARNDERRGEAESLSGDVEGIIVTLLRQAGESGQLYGSVNARDIAAAVGEATGLSVNRQQVRLDQPIKAIGVHDVAIALHPEVFVHVKVNVARTEDEAALQARSGLPAAEAVLAAEEEDAERAAAAEAEALFETADDEPDAGDNNLDGADSGDDRPGKGNDEAS
jgi:large subunit ribosomal protein L9